MIFKMNAVKKQHKQISQFFFEVVKINGSHLDFKICKKLYIVK